jgi:hypothetical protein
MKSSTMAGMTAKQARMTRKAKKVVTKPTGKKATEKVMVKPKESNAKNPENKFVWKPFGR